VVIEKFTSISSPSQANYTFRLVRLLFNFARSIRNDEGKPIVTNNAVAVLSQRRIWHDQKPSRKVIKLAALKAWWDAVQQLQEVDTPRADGGRFTAGGTSLNSNVDAARDFLAFLLLTGLRRNEAATLKWETVDLPAKMLTITKTKNYEAHVLPLSDYLYDMLMRRHAAIPKGEKGTLRASYVFPSEEGPLKGIQKQLDKVIALSGVTFSAQTLRRTFGTIAEGRDIPYLALKRLLNHKAQDVTGGSYTVIDVERLREPMQKITDFILSHVGERPAARVVKIRAAKDKA
jgi:integrase